MMMECKIFFADEKLKKAYEDLVTSVVEDIKLHKWITRALKDIKEDCFCGIQIPKKQIPRDYTQKYDIDNLWKYDLPSAWRLIYTVKKEEVLIISIVLEWMSHKEYERRFKY